MLKTRVVGVLVVKGDIVVQSVNFKQYLPVGSPAIAIEYLNRWGIDEIIMLDIDATLESRGPKNNMIKECSRYCQVPLTVGGGIRSVPHMEELIRSGADKVSINSAISDNPALITEGARIFGSQCIIASIDARSIGEGKYETFTRGGKRSTGKTPVSMAKLAEEYGAGEIFLNSIDRDGSKEGYDLCLIQQVLEAVNIPVIVCGGVNHPGHFQEAMDLEVSGAAAANFFHYTEHSVISAKGFLRGARDDIRLDSYATYRGYEFDDHGRAAKKGDLTLEKLRFEYIPEEVI